MPYTDRKINMYRYVVERSSSPKFRTVFIGYQIL